MFVQMWTLDSLLMKALSSCSSTTWRLSPRVSADTKFSSFLFRRLSPTNTSSSTGARSCPASSGTEQSRAHSSGRHRAALLTLCFYFQWFPRSCSSRRRMTTNKQTVCFRDIKEHSSISNSGVTMETFLLVVFWQLSCWFFLLVCMVSSSSSAVLPDHTTLTCLQVAVCLKAAMTWTRN